VIGAGDVATALIAACAAVEADRLLAAACGLVLLAAAAVQAAAAAPGPGSLLPALLDALAALAPAPVVAHARAHAKEDAWT
jgi:hydroxyethylthiazole kinase